MMVEKYDASQQLERQRHEARQRMLAVLFALLDWLEQLWRPRRHKAIVLNTTVLEASPTGLLVSSDTQPNLEPLYRQTNQELRRYVEGRWGKEHVSSIGTFATLPPVPQHGGRHRRDELVPHSETVVLRTPEGWARYGNGAGVLLAEPAKIF